MAITLTDGQFAAALRIEQTVIDPAVSRLRSAVSAYVDQRAPLVPAAIGDEAVSRMGGYLYDAPESARGDSYASAWLNSGAAELCGPWIKRRAEAIG